MAAPKHQGSRRDGMPDHAALLDSADSRMAMPSARQSERKSTGARLRSTEGGWSRHATGQSSYPQRKHPGIFFSALPSVAAHFEQTNLSCYPWPDFSFALRTKHTNRDKIRYTMSTLVLTKFRRNYPAIASSLVKLRWAGISPEKAGHAASAAGLTVLSIANKRH